MDLPPPKIRLISFLFFAIDRATGLAGFEGALFATLLSNGAFQRGKDRTGERKQEIYVFLRFFEEEAFKDEFVFFFFFSAVGASSPCPAARPSHLTTESCDVIYSRVTIALVRVECTRRY